MGNKAKNHNGVISIWKFIYCLMIICFHVTLYIKTGYKINFKGGAIGVEFFFLVSGYLLGKKALNYKEVNSKNLGSETVKYIKEKVCAMYPYIVLIYAFSLPILIFLRSYNGYKVLNSIFDLVLLQSIGFYTVTHVIGVAWYISAMIICMILLYPLILKYRKNFVYIIAPLVVFIIWGYLIRRHKSISDAWLWDGFLLQGVEKAFFELMLGVMCYAVSEKIKNIKFTQLAKVILTIVEVVGFCSILYLVNKSGANVKYDSVMILILFWAVAIAFSGKTLLTKYFNNKFVYFLEKISLPMYLNQMWIIELVIFLAKKFANVNIEFYMCCIFTILLDFVISLVAIQVINFVKNNSKKLRSIFVEEK